MKQQIIRCSNGSIKRIFNYNNSGQFHGLVVGYWFIDSSIMGITNWVNGKRFGHSTYKPYSSEIKQSYYL